MTGAMLCARQATANKHPASVRKKMRVANLCRKRCMNPSAKRQTVAAGVGDCDFRDDVILVAAAMSRLESSRAEPFFRRSEGSREHNNGTDYPALRSSFLGTSSLGTSKIGSSSHSNDNARALVSIGSSSGMSSATDAP